MKKTRARGRTRQGKNGKSDGNRIGKGAAERGGIRTMSWEVDRGPIDRELERDEEERRRARRGRVRGGPRRQWKCPKSGREMTTWRFKTHQRRGFEQSGHGDELDAIKAKKEIRGRGARDACPCALPLSRGDIGYHRRRCDGWKRVGDGMLSDTFVAR